VIVQADLVGTTREGWGDFGFWVGASGGGYCCGSWSGDVDLVQV
jgi:hypothetical protein